MVMWWWIIPPDTASGWPDYGSFPMTRCHKNTVMYGIEKPKWCTEGMVHKQWTLFQSSFSQRDGCNYFKSMHIWWHLKRCCVKTVYSNRPLPLRVWYFSSASTRGIRDEPFDFCGERWRNRMGKIILYIFLTGETFYTFTKVLHIL